MARKISAFLLALVTTCATAGELEFRNYTFDIIPGEDPDYALGYPVPTPVASQTPVTGFRTYDSLHARYQDLMLTNDKIQGSVVGQSIYGRDIWAYQLSDDNNLTIDGLVEPAMLMNGTIHVREWQSPEFLAGIIERFAENSDDGYIHQYLMENANIIVVPVNNPDGLLQTQRYPNRVVVGGDPSVSSWPRDGRMRRKNMRNVDENLNTLDDHLFGIDLNRNTDPFWAFNVTGQFPTISSSDNVESLVYHGSGPFSEPESQAREAAADLGPLDRLRFYVDAHSFGSFTPWHRTTFGPLNEYTFELMTKLSNHHVAYPEGRFYFPPPISNGPLGQGGGATDESFAERYRVVSWTLETEPWQGGTDYGGFGAEHDGFILPNSEVPRLRTELSETYVFGFYEMAGPPAVKHLQLLDAATNAVIFDAEWDVISDTKRELNVIQIQPLAFDRLYTLWLSFDKPMFWRNEAGELDGLQGQGNSGDIDVEATVDGEPLEAQVTGIDGTMDPGGSPRGYHRYQDDAVWVDFSLDPQEIEGTVSVDLSVTASDMMGMPIDADPATVVDWDNGQWTNYETGAAKGTDSSLSFDLTADPVAVPFVVEPGTSASWFDVDHDGEGFLIEILSEDSALVYWFTYDELGNQRWFFGTARIVGNRLIIDDLLTSSGGKFGPGFDPADVEFTRVGNASFLFRNCSNGWMKYTVNGKSGRQTITRITDILGLGCGTGAVADKGIAGITSGSWYDITHDGEGFLIEILSDTLALVYWFSYDADGNQRWFFGVGTIDGDTITIDEVFTTRGGLFGPDFDPADVELLPWGSMSFTLGCDSGSMNYNSTEAGFGAGGLNLSRITFLAGFDC